VLLLCGVLNTASRQGFKYQLISLCLSCLPYSDSSLHLHDFRGIQDAMAGTGPTNQSRTILGPLTTTFTPPLSCTVQVQGGGPTNNQAWQGQSCDGTNGRGYSDNTACWPPATVTAPSPVGTLATWGFYSPGLVCPIGMTTACYATGGGSSGWQVEFSLLAQETAVGCCPTYSIIISPPDSNADDTVVAFPAPISMRKHVYGLRPQRPSPS
jgi:hypothetical protein